MNQLLISQKIVFKTVDEGIKQNGCSHLSALLPPNIFFGELELSKGSFTIKCRVIESVRFHGDKGSGPSWGVSKG